MIEIVEMIVSLVENYLLEAGLREGESVWGQIHSSVTRPT